MVDFRTVVIAVLLGTFILNVTGEKHKRLRARGYDHEHLQRPCKNNGKMDSSEHPCEDNSQNGNTDDTTAGPTASENARWCRFGNGTYLALGQTFMKSTCSMCQCTKARLIRCASLDCLPAYCIDNKMPIRKPNQCCAQCDYEPDSNKCVYKGVSYPHGAVIKSIENKMQCWCQLGNIECRNYIGSLFQALNFLSDEKTIYVIVIVVVAVLFFGLLLCCGCTLSIYYYFHKNQHELQQIYNQYFNQAGWQPMNEDGEVVNDNGAEEKQAEAEKNQNEFVQGETVPPPYHIENISYVPDEKQK